MTAHIRPSTPGGSVALPPSKSIAHRALICAALASGVSFVSPLELSEDISATLVALQRFGATAKLSGADCTLHGTGGQLQSATSINCAASASTLRFLLPLAALSQATTHFTGIPRLLKRPHTPFERLFALLRLPYKLTDSSLSIAGPLQPGLYTLDASLSSQFVSGLLFALPLLGKPSTIQLTGNIVSRGYIELTREVQAAFGVHSHWQDPATLIIPAHQRYTACSYTIPADWSAAAPFAVVGAVHGGALLHGLCAETQQPDAAILPILQQCGARFCQMGNELRFLAPSAGGLCAPPPIDVSGCPDIAPALCVLALFCSGTTVLQNTARLKTKESSRMAAMQEELRRLGAEIHIQQNSVHISGPQQLCGGAQLASHNDHRIAMALAAAACGAGISVSISGAQAINKSWPSFFTALNSIGTEVDIT